MAAFSTVSIATPGELLTFARMPRSETTCAVAPPARRRRPAAKRSVSAASFESQVVRRSDSKVLAVDRETSVAVDTVEGIAGKTALENAAAKVLDRLLAKIVAQ